jgi:predicted FMN-binding regulatory protein PaiB
VRPFSYIPSTIGGVNFACQATQFFASAICEGEITILNDLEQKAKALNILMSKFQEKDTFLDFEENIEKYKNMLEKTAVFCFKIKEWSLKVKVGQNMSKDKIDELIKKLEQSESKIDELTIKQIRLFCR